ncbi:hypothetical protein D047_0874B, partial [Vibrio parahaemolyticus VPTS-2010_2]
ALIAVASIEKPFSSFSSKFLVCTSKRSRSSLFNSPGY